jgi:small GTP-binding protein
MGLIKRRRDKKRTKQNASYFNKQSLIEPKFKGKAHFDPYFLFKVLLIGYSDSGSIDYLKSFGDSWFKENTKLSIGISFEVKKIMIEHLNIKLQIWDLSIKDRWRDMVPYYCRGAVGAILMFEISNSNTFHMLSKWVKIIRDNTKNIPVILIGNKNDLNRQVTEEQSLDFVRSEQLNGYIECNVLTGENVNKVFESLTRMILTNIKPKSLI